MILRALKLLWIWVKFRVWGPCVDYENGHVQRLKEIDRRDAIAIAAFDFDMAVTPQSGLKLLRSAPKPIPQSHWIPAQDQKFSYVVMSGNSAPYVHASNCAAPAWNPVYADMARNIGYGVCPQCGSAWGFDKYKFGCESCNTHMQARRVA